MSETTQILFNSPALRSLKRDQLIKLCKIHSIKASGKNVDLINRLKQRAQTLAAADLLTVTTQSDHTPEMDAGEDMDSEIEIDREDTGCHSFLRSGAERPSEPWEMVIEKVAEDESQSILPFLETTTMAREFGAGGY